MRTSHTRHALALEQKVDPMGLFTWLGRLGMKSSMSRRPRARPTVEALEERFLLAGDIVFEPGVGPRWTARQQQILAARATNPSVVFMGDSILDYYANGAGAASWQGGIAPLRAQDFAITGNTTEQIAQQVALGDLDGLRAQVIVLMIGTNNLAFGETPANLFEGVSFDLAVLRSVQPQANILLLGLPPLGWSPNDPVRERVTQTNSLLARLDNGQTIRFLDVGSRFLQPNGQIIPGALYDSVHPSATGYQILTDAIRQPIIAMQQGNAASVRPLARSLTPVAGDWNGDGRATPGVFDPYTATWSLRNSASGSPESMFAFGAPGEVPVTGDWIGAGSTQVGVFDPATATWTLRAGPGRPDLVFQYGLPGWLPVTGDWNGDGVVTIGVFDPFTATFYLRNTNSGGPADAVFQYGTPGTVPVAGDWTGRGASSVGVVDLASMTWYVQSAAGNGGTTSFQFGGVGWSVLPADRNGTGVTAPAVVDDNGNVFLRTNPSFVPPRGAVGTSR